MEEVAGVRRDEGLGVIDVMGVWGLFGLFVEGVGSASWTEFFELEPLLL